MNVSITRRAFLAGVAGTTATIACGPGPVGSLAVGNVVGTDAFVAVVTDNARFVAYLCDGRTIAAWFQGMVSGNRLDASNARGTFGATIENGAVSGTFTPMGTSGMAFSAPDAGDSARLFQAIIENSGTSYVAGWIARRDGAQRGAIQNRRTGAVVDTPMLNVETATSMTAMLGTVMATEILRVNDALNAYLR